MGQDPSIQALATEWRALLSERRRQTSADLTARLSRELVDPQSAKPASRETALRQIREALWPLVSGELLDQCASWMQEQGDWPGSIDALDLYSEVRRAATLLPYPSVPPEPPSIAVKPTSWIAPCAVGGLIGGPILGLDWVGVLLGSTGLVAGVAWLIEQPEIRQRWNPEDAHRKGLSESGRDSPLESLRANRLLRGVTLKVAVKLLRLLLRPASSGPAPMSLLTLRRAIEADLDLCSTLPLLMCWSRLTARSERPNSVSPGLQSTAVYAAIGALEQRLGQEPEDPDAIRDLALELVQTMRDEGFAWRSVPDGTAYSEDMESAYTTFGHIGQGQPVRTLKPALFAGDVLVTPGVLQRMRG